MPMCKPAQINAFSGDYRYLSNFWKVPIQYEGITYPSVEHAYQAAKTLDQIDRQKLTYLTAAEAKQYGRRVKRRPDWEACKLDVMRALLQLKFAPGTTYHQMLVSTAPAELIEGNWWGDTYWGVCRGVGENWLGRLLMEIRDRA